MTKRVAAGLALALVLAGCEAFYTPVPLITGSGLPEGSCFTFGVQGLLLDDPKYGTAIEQTDGLIRVVAWRPGFTGRRVGTTEVEVLDPKGNVVAVTGHKYSMDGGYVSRRGMGSWPGFPPDVDVAFWACGSVTEGVVFPHWTPGMTLRSGISARIG